MCLTWIALLPWGCCKVTNVTRCNARYATFASVRRIHVMPSTFASFFFGPTRSTSPTPSYLQEWRPGPWSTPDQIHNVKVFMVNTHNTNFGFLVFSHWQLTTIKQISYSSFSLVNAKWISLQINFFTPLLQSLKQSFGQQVFLLSLPILSPLILFRITLSSSR